MKNKIPALLLLLVAILTIAAVNGTDWTQGPTILWRYQSDPVFTKDTLATAPVTAFFGYTLSNASTGESQFFQAGQVSFDMVVLGKETVTSGDVTVTYAQLAALNGQAATDQWDKQQKK